MPAAELARPAAALHRPRRSAPILAMAALMLHCAGAPHPRPTAARGSTVLVNQTLLPPDLDVAVRLDLPRLRAWFGAELAQKVITDALLSPEDVAGPALLARVLARTELLWLGLRSRRDARGWDKVLVLRGNFSSWNDWSELGRSWTASEDGPRVWRRDASPPGDVLALLRAVGDGLIFMSQSPASSSPGPDENRDALHPPDRGMLSVAALPTRLAETRVGDYPRLARHFTEARRLMLHVEPSAMGLVVEAELDYASDARALASRDVFTLLLERVSAETCVWGALARSAELTVFETSLRLHSAATEALVRSLEACVLAGECCV